SVTEVWGECGIGKTSLLRHVAHRATTEFADWPIVYLSAAGQPIEDLLQEIHTSSTSRAIRRSSALQLFVENCGAHHPFCCSTTWLCRRPTWRTSCARCRSREWCSLPPLPVVKRADPSSWAVSTSLQRSS